jgi:DNA helicase IV
MKNSEEINRYCFYYTGSAEEIIREAINKTVVIQGVAGSGKTTIILPGLHPVLMHTNRIIHPERSL